MMRNPIKRIWDRSGDARDIVLRLTGPAVPTAQAASETLTTSFIANWTNEEYAEYFELQVATDSAFTSFVTGYSGDGLRVNARQYRVTGVSAGVTYYYRVRAVGPNGRTQWSNTISIVASLTLARTVDGLLYRFQYDDPAFPFVSGDWTVENADVTNLGLSAEGALRMRCNVNNSSRRIKYTPEPARTKAFIFGVLRAETLGSGGRNTQPRLTAHITDPGMGGSVAWLFSVQRGLTGNPEIVQLTGGGGSETIVARNINIDYPVALAVDGTAFRGYDHTDNKLHTGTQVGLGSGFIGIGIFGSDGTGHITQTRKWFAMKDRFVTVNGVPTGGSAAIRRLDGTLVASANEVAGVASIDLMQAVFPGLTTLQVRDSGATVIAELIPAGQVWGGDTYAYA